MPNKLQLNITLIKKVTTLLNIGLAIYLLWDLFRAELWFFSPFLLFYLVPFLNLFVLKTGRLKIGAILFNIAMPIYFRRTIFSVSNVVVYFLMHPFVFCFFLLTPLLTIFVIIKQIIDDRKNHQNLGQS